MANQIDFNESDITSFEFENNKLYKLILRIEPHLSRILFLTSTFLFLLENTVLKLPFLLNNLFNPFMWLILLIWISILFVFPFRIHSFLVKKQLREFKKSYEMMASLVIFISGFFIQSLPDIQLCALTVFGTVCSTYPGGFLVGLIFIIILMVPSYFIISKFSKIKELTNVIVNFDPILSKLHASMNGIKEKIFQNTKDLNESTESFVKSAKNSQEGDLYNQADKYNNLMAQIFYFKELIDEIQTNPQILNNRAIYAYEHNQFELGISLSIKSITNSRKVKKMDLMKRYHTLALNLVGKKNYENAFNVFKFILNNTRSLNIVDFEIFSTVLNNLNHKSAYNAIEQRDYKSIFRILKIRYRPLIYFYEKVKDIFFILIIIVSIILLLTFLEVFVK